MERKLNVRKLVAYFGGQKRLQGLYAKYAAIYGWRPVPYNTIASWTRENAIRTPALVNLKVIAEHENMNLDFDHFTSQTEQEGS